MPTISEMYPVPAEMKKLHVFLGEWSVEGTIKTGGSVMRLKGEWNFGTAAGGWGLKSSNKFEVKELGTMSWTTYLASIRRPEDCISIVSLIWQKHMTIRLPGLTKIR